MKIRAKKLKLVTSHLKFIIRIVIEPQSVLCKVHDRKISGKALLFTKLKYELFLKKEINRTCKHCYSIKKLSLFNADVFCYNI